MIPKLTEWHQRYERTGNTGSVLVEFAIIAPLLIVLALGIGDYGMLIINTASLAGATRALAEYARNSPACGVGGLANSSCITGIGDFVTNLKSNDTALSTASFSYPTGDLSAAGGNYCTCVDGTVIDCSAGTCNVSGDTRIVQYIQISAIQDFSPLFAVINFGYFSPTNFGFPSPLSAQTTIRIQ